MVATTPAPVVAVAENGATPGPARMSTPQGQPQEPTEDKVDVDDDDGEGDGGGAGGGEEETDIIGSSVSTARVEVVLTIVGAVLGAVLASGVIIWACTRKGRRRTRAESHSVGRGGAAV